MLEEEFRVDNQNDSRENSESEIQVDNFSKTTKLLDKKLKDKKDNILKVLDKWNLKDLFERLLLSDTEDKRKCIEELLTCENDEIKIKEVILANLPDWYAYNVSTNEVVKTEEKKDNDYIWATIMDQKTEQAKTDTEQAKTDTEQAKTDTEQAVETKRLGESILVMRQAIEERDKLVAKYQSLDAKTNQSSENFQTVKKQLENNWTLNQLRQNHDEQFINDYILVQATLVELKSNPTSYEQNDISYFDKLVKNLNNACNVPDTNLSSFSSENISQTRTELFSSEVWNDSLIQAKELNLKTHDYSDVFPEKIETDELITKYGNFLEWQIKQFLENYVNNTGGLKDKIEEIKNNDNPTEEDKKLLQIYNYMIAELDKKRKETEEQTKNMMEELCIISQIKWMYMCMWEWADFNLNKAREIESEDWILTLRGHIDWVEFAIRQDTNNPEAKLQTSTKLAKERNNKDDTNKSENFIVWWKDKFVDSNFILPSQDQIFALITETVSSDLFLKNSNSQEEYLEKLQENIMWKVEKEYEKTKYAQHYMQEQVKWEKIIDKTISFVEKLKGVDIDSRINNSSAQLYNFLNLMDFNIKHSTSAEKDKLYRIMDKIDRMTGLAQYNSSDWELLAHQDKFSQYLTGDSLLNTRSTLKGNQVEWSNKYAFDLFKNYENLSDERKFWGLHMINFDQMLVDLNKVEIQQKEKQEKTTRDLALSKLDEDLEIAYA